MVALYATLFSFGHKLLPMGQFDEIRIILKNPHGPPEIGAKPLFGPPYPIGMSRFDSRYKEGRHRNF